METIEMKKYTYALATLGIFASTALTAQAQFYKLHNADIGGGAIGQFTTALPAQNSSNVQDFTTNSFGGMFTLRDHPVSWAGVEFNYGFTEYHHDYSIYPSGTAQTKNDAHEATAAYLFHPHFRNLQPFIALGGGYIDFVPVQTGGQNQWRGTGLVEVGLDIPTSNPHMGFRVQGRELIYRSPDFGQSNIASRDWVATAEPSFGVWYRF
jgi:hypothetical protein